MHPHTLIQLFFLTSLCHQVFLSQLTAFLHHSCISLAMSDTIQSTPLSQEASPLPPNPANFPVPNFDTNKQWAETIELAVENGAQCNKFVAGMKKRWEEKQVEHEKAWDKHMEKLRTAQVTQDAKDRAATKLVADFKDAEHKKHMIKVP